MWESFELHGFSCPRSCSRHPTILHYSHSIPNTPDALALSPLVLPIWNKLTLKGLYHPPSPGLLLSWRLLLEESHKPGLLVSQILSTSTQLHSLTFLSKSPPLILKMWLESEGLHFYCYLILIDLNFHCVMWLAATTDYRTVPDYRKFY